MIITDWIRTYEFLGYAPSDALEQEIFDKRNDPLNPLARFVKYSPSTRSIIIPCPQVNLLNGPPNVTGCPLPNTILNSIIPR